MPTTRIKRYIDAPRAVVYQALLDPKAIAEWRVPDGMTSHVHEFDAREGGYLRVSLTYESADQVGKTSSHTDTYHGHFVKLVRNEQVIEVDEFESSDPALQGKMTISFTLADRDRGTEILAVHEGLPGAVSSEDNEIGWAMALAKLAALVEKEGGRGAQPPA